MQENLLQVAKHYSQLLEEDKLSPDVAFATKGFIEALILNGTPKIRTQTWKNKDLKTGAELAKTWNLETLLSELDKQSLNTKSRWQLSNPIEGHTITTWITQELKDYKQGDFKDQFWAGYRFAILRAYNFISKEHFSPQIRAKASELEQSLRDHRLADGSRII